MNIIAIETSSRVGSVALVRNGTVARDLSFEKGMEHGRLLQVKLDEICRAEGVAPRQDIDAVAVSQGPGSFTGLRVGVACAKALAFAIERPIVAVCSFDALACNAPADAARACTTLDAKRGDVYFGVYERDGQDWIRREGPAVARPEEVVAKLERPVWVLGDAARAHRYAFSGEGLHIAPEEAWRVRAGEVGLLGHRMAIEGRFADPDALVPIYLRRPEAEEKRLASSM